MLGQELPKKIPKVWKESEIDMPNQFFINEIWGSPIYQGKIWRNVLEELEEFNLENLFAKYERHDKLKKEEEFKEGSYFVNKIFLKCISFKLKEINDEKDEFVAENNDLKVERELLFLSRYLNALKLYNRYSSLISKHNDSITASNDFGIALREFNWAPSNLLVKKEEAKSDLLEKKIADPKAFNYFILVYSFQEWKEIVKSEVLRHHLNNRQGILRKLDALLIEFWKKSDANCLNHYRHKNFDKDKSLFLLDIESTDLELYKDYLTNFTQTIEEDMFEKISTKCLKDIWNDFQTKQKKLGLSDLEIMYLITSMFNSKKMILGGKTFKAIYELDDGLEMNVSQKKVLKLLIFSIWEKYLEVDESQPISKSNYLKNWSITLKKKAKGFSISNLYESNPKILKNIKQV